MQLASIACADSNDRADDACARKQSVTYDSLGPERLEKSVRHQLAVRLFHESCAICRPEPGVAAQAVADSSYNPWHAHIGCGSR